MDTVNKDFSHKNDIVVLTISRKIIESSPGQNSRTTNFQFRWFEILEEHGLGSRHALASLRD